MDNQVSKSAEQVADAVRFQVHPDIYASPVYLEGLLHRIKAAYFDKEWKSVERLFEAEIEEMQKRVPRMSSQTASAASPVAGEEVNVKVIRLGLGEVVSNWGTHNGVPAIFIEPAYSHSGEVGRILEKHEQPHIKANAVTDEGIIIELHGRDGWNVVAEDAANALGSVRWTGDSEPGVVCARERAETPESTPPSVQEEKGSSE